MDWQIAYNLKKLIEEYYIESIPFTEICEKGEGGIEEIVLEEEHFRKQK